MSFKDQASKDDARKEFSAEQVIVFPGVENLKKEVEKMRTELSMLLLERDELLLVICPNIETDYMLKLGSIEYKAYEAMCAMLRLKRKIELLQAKRNRQENIVLIDIEKVLDEEFVEYQRQLEEQLNKMNEALHRSCLEALSQEDTRELKKLYRKIMKLLHPDLNPGLSKAKTELFHHAVSAYKNGDLDTLRMIFEMVGDNPLPELKSDAMTQLTEEKERLKDLLKSITDSIEKIKSSYPYTLKELLEDEKKIKEKKQESEEILKQYQEMIALYKRRIEEILR